MERAEFLDYVLRRYPGYTLRTLLAEDAHELKMLIALTDPKLGEKRG